MSKDFRGARHPSGNPQPGQARPSFNYNGLGRQKENTLDRADMSPGRAGPRNIGPSSYKLTKMHPKSQQGREKLLNDIEMG